MRSNHAAVGRTSLGPVRSSLSLFHWEEELLAICLALIAGARYGVKIRLPHAAVMTFLFKRDLGSLQKLQSVLRLVFEHATNLAAFAFLYKAALASLKWTSRRQNFLHDAVLHPGGMLRRYGQALMSLIVQTPPNELISASTTRPFSPRSIISIGQPEHPYHALLAGAFGGYFVWGRYSSVNYQIVLYLTSRVGVALLQRHWQQVPVRWRKLVPEFWKERRYSIGAALVWSLVMFLFETSPEVLHPSLRSSMDEIYRVRRQESTGNRSLDATVADTSRAAP